MITTPSRDKEYVDNYGYLRVPVAHSMSPTPSRPGWKPFFVVVLLKDPIQKVVVYKREETPSDD